ncbi:MAG: hypothetical protein Q9172_006792 [Xanthocarpia lactea]
MSHPTKPIEHKDPQLAFVMTDRSRELWRMTMPTFCKNVERGDTEIVGVQQQQRRPRVLHAAADSMTAPMNPMALIASPNNLVGSPPDRHPGAHILVPVLTDDRELGLSTTYAIARRNCQSTPEGLSIDVPEKIYRPRNLCGSCTISSLAGGENEKSFSVGSLGIFLKADKTSPVLRGWPYPHSVQCN